MWEPVREVSVGGFPCQVHEPSQARPAGAVIYLHDVRAEGLVEAGALPAELAARGLAVVAPLTGRSWWSDRICPAFAAHLSAERHVCENVVAWIADRWGLSPPRIALLGRGMGGQGALRIAYKHPARFPLVAAISPAIDHQIYFDHDPVLPTIYTDPEAVRQDTATLHIHPLNWPRLQFFCCAPQDRWWWESADRLRMKLFSLGVPHQCDLETEWPDGDASRYVERMTTRVLDFLCGGLEQERRRLGP